MLFYGTVRKLGVKSIQGYLAECVSKMRNYFRFVILTFVLGGEQCSE